MNLLIELVNSFVNSLNTREMAIIILLFAFLIGISFIKGVRKAAKDIIKIFFSIKLIIPFISMLLYIFLILFVLYYIGFLNINLTKDIVFWFVIVAIPLFFTANKVRENKNFFKNEAMEYIKLTTIFGFLINFYTFNLFIEIILQLSLFIIILFISFSKTDKKYKSVEAFFNIIFLIVFVYLVIFFINSFLINFNELININTGISYILPAVLTILFLPFVYMLALYMRYELFYVFSKTQFNDSKLHIYVFKEVFKRNKLNLYELHDFLLNFRIFDINNIEDVKKEIEKAENRILLDKKIKIK